MGRYADLPLGPLAALPEPVREELLADAVYEELADRAVVRPGERPSGMALNLSGLIRLFVMQAGGREFTVNALGPGRLWGLGGVLPAGPFDASALAAQALTDTRLLWIPTPTLRKVAAWEISLAHLLIRELTLISNDLTRNLVGTAFGSLRQRVAHHLLVLLGGLPASAESVVPVTQQELADAVGCQREAVARTLRGLRSDGLLRTTPRGIQICDATALAAEAGAAYVM